MKYFGEVLTAMVTPFDQNLKLDLNAARELVEHLIATGTDTIVVAGTTGEGPTLTKMEKLTLFTTVAETANKRIKVIANVGNNNTSESIDFAKEVEKLNVVDGIMLVNPYYNKPSQKGLYEHFKAVSESVKLPVMLYNIPGRTSVNLDYNTTIELSKIPNIIAVKESGGNLSQIARIVENTTDDFAVYSGDDNLTLPILSVGGDGVVSVASHIVGNEIKEMIFSYKNGDTAKASQIHRKFLPFFEGIFFETNPVPIKNVLNHENIKVGSVRLPLVDLEDSQQGKVKELLEMVNFARL
jgi:4-hydroxy-tetrahydrodipicolinate synthase